MKAKIVFILGLLIGCILVVTGQVDTTGTAEVSQAFNIDASWIIGAGSVLAYVVGHFAIPKKWTSATLWLEKVVYKIYIGLKWFNNNTNRVKK
jgi:uncharacterized membrane protein